MDLINYITSRKSNQREIETDQDPALRSFFTMEQKQAASCQSEIGQNARPHIFSNKPYMFSSPLKTNELS